MEQELPEDLLEQMNRSELIGDPESVLPTLECEHGMEACVYTSWTWKNPGRRFYRCPVWMHDDCRYFKWFDHWINRYYKELMYSSVKEKKNLKQEVYLLKEKEKLLYEKLRIVEENKINLKDENERLHKRIERLTSMKSELVAQKKNLKREKERMKYAILVLAIALFVIVIGCNQFWKGRNYSGVYKTLP